MANTAKNTRVIDQKFLISGNDADSVEYNIASGACKSLLVGPRLLPIPTGNGTWTTNVATATALPLFGLTLYVYNNSGTAASVTIGQSGSVTSQAIGAVDTNGNVGVALAPNAYTLVSMGFNQWIISSASTVIVYIVEDPTWLNQQTGPLVQQTPLPTFVPPVNS